jgi:uncharacterized membrane protein
MVPTITSSRTLEAYWPIADYEAIYSDLGILDSFDAAVLTRQPDGKVIIVKRVDEQSDEESKGKARWVAGLAVGTAVALFPAVALGIPVAGLGMGLLAGAGMGAVIGGHVARGITRSDLKDLGELLDRGTSGLLVVTTTDIEARVEAAITLATSGPKLSSMPTTMLSRRRSVVRHSGGSPLLRQ